MSTFDSTLAPTPSPARGGGIGRGSLAQRITSPLFASALFVSALLLFAVQPMFTKMILPKLGGAPAVWSVAMVAFQAFLFIGYLYAHLIARTFTPARAAVVHLAVLAVVAVTLPLGIAPAFNMPPADGVMLWLVGLFAASIGVPFIALLPPRRCCRAGSSRPATRRRTILMFSMPPRTSARSPAAELSLRGRAVSDAQYAVAGLVPGFFGARGPHRCGRMPGRAQRRRGVGPRRRPGAPPTILQRLSWLALTAVPAGLVVAVTAYITTDIAAAPFLWVVPLALYLLTFVGVFRERPWFSHAAVLRYLPYVVAPLAVSILGRDKVHWLAIILLNLIAFVMIALACHGEAYRRRPRRSGLPNSICGPRSAACSAACSPA